MPPTRLRSLAATMLTLCMTTASAPAHAALDPESPNCKRCVKTDAGYFVMAGITGALNGLYVGLLATREGELPPFAHAWGLAIGAISIVAGGLALARPPVGSIEARNIGGALTIATGVPSLLLGFVWLVSKPGDGGKPGAPPPTGWGSDDRVVRLDVPMPIVIVSPEGYAAPAVALLHGGF
jgi:hypothetical protein